MARTVAIGLQDFEKVRTRNVFYVDKTDFIREWWDNGDDVTLITRPRRFGKTLNMSMVEQFFSVDYADRGELFEGLSIWKNEKYRQLQGTYPVISLSFANACKLSKSIYNNMIRTVIFAEPYHFNHETSHPVKPDFLSNCYICFSLLHMSLSL